MATADQIKSLIKAHNDNDNEKFRTVVLQIAAYEAKLNHETFWPTSLYITKTVIINDRWSFSTGGHVLYKKWIQEGSIWGEFGGYSGPTKNTFRVGIFDIPIRINFHIKKIDDNFNFYLKSEIKNSIMAGQIISEPNHSGDFRTDLNVGYNMFFGFGLGSDFKISNRLSIVIEPGWTYSVFGKNPGIGFIDCQIGVKYDLIKKGLSKK